MLTKRTHSDAAIGAGLPVRTSPPTYRVLVNPVALSFVLVIAAGSTRPALAGPCIIERTHNESGDAGATAAAAQKTIGVGSLNCVIGTLSGIGPRVGDFEDVYEIRITNPATYSASFVDNGGTASFNTELFLFDAGGFGILANDDFSLGNNRSKIPTTGADDGTGQVVPAAGTYFLAITGSANKPTSATGLIFDQLTTTEVSGPDGPGNGDTQTGWDNSGGGVIGGYVIALTGAEFAAPPPGIPTLSEWGLVVLALLMLTAGTIVLRRGQRHTATP